MHILTCGCLFFHPFVGKFKILAYRDVFHLDCFLDFSRMKYFDFNQQRCYILIPTTLHNLFQHSKHHKQHSCGGFFCYFLFLVFKYFYFFLILFYF